MANKNHTAQPQNSGPSGMRSSMQAIPEKPKDFKKTMKKLIQYCKPYYGALIFILVATVVGTVFQVIGPAKLRDMTDEITKGLATGIDLDAVTSIAILLVILYGSSAILNFIQGYLMVGVTQDISKNLRTDIENKINKLPLKYFDKNSVGDVLSRVTNDVDAIGQTLNQSGGQLISSIVLLLGSLGIMLYMNIIMTLTAVFATLIGFILMAVIMKKSQVHFVNQQKELGMLGGHIEEIYSGHNIVKAYNGEERARTEFEKINDKLFSSVWKAQFLSGLMMPIMMFVGNLGFVSVCIVGAVLAINGEITFGVIVAFMIYVRLFTQPLGQIAQAATNLQRTAAASERIFSFLNEVELDDESTKSETFSNVTGNVEFSHVKFGYEKDKPVIKDFSMKISAGQKVAIVGPTGAGKTTIVNLLMRFYELDSGEILLDGIPISKVKREEVHSQFCMVLQDTWLFEGTIKENIIYCKENVSDKEVIKACKEVGMHHFINSLPSGYDTVLNDKASLSQGQKQLLTIARAMVDNSPFLVLDEATSSVDTRTEVLIQESMDKLTKKRTSFVIAHRLSTIKNADVILVLKNGDILETGTHEELLKMGGFYSELYYSQFENVS